MDGSFSNINLDWNNFHLHIQIGDCFLFPYKFKLEVIFLLPYKFKLEVDFLLSYNSNWRLFPSPIQIQIGGSFLLQSKFKSEEFYSWLSKAMKKSSIIYLKLDIMPHQRVLSIEIREKNKRVLRDNVNMVRL